MKAGAHPLKLRVLTYHRVADPSSTPELNPRLISATPEAFERQMRFLLRRHAVVSMAEVLEGFDTGRALPRRAVLVTFDDAYADLVVHAVPVLKRLGLSATIFVPTAFPGHPERSFWADRLHRAFQGAGCSEIATPIGRLPNRTPEDRRASLKRLQGGLLKRIPHAEATVLVDEICESLGARPAAFKSVLSWDELRELAGQGFAIGAHSRTHALLTQLPLTEVRNEVAGSREDLGRELREALPVFCYPNGGHDEDVVSIVREEGYRLAFTTLDGDNDLSVDDPLRLRRTNITPRTSALTFRIRMTAWGARLDAWRHSNRG